MVLNITKQTRVLDPHDQYRAYRAVSELKGEKGKKGRRIGLAGGITGRGMVKYSTNRGRKRSGHLRDHEAILRDLF